MKQFFLSILMFIVFLNLIPSITQAGGGSLGNYARYVSKLGPNDPIKETDYVDFLKKCEDKLIGSEGVSKAQIEANKQIQQFLELAIVNVKKDCIFYKSTMKARCNIKTGNPPIPSKILDIVINPNCSHEIDSLAKNANSEKLKQCLLSSYRIYWISSDTPVCKTGPELKAVTAPIMPQKKSADGAVQ